MQVNIIIPPPLYFLEDHVEEKTPFPISLPKRGIYE
jgi:hypothetical protein